MQVPCLRAKIMWCTQILTFRFIIIILWATLNLLTSVVVIRSTTPTVDAKYLTTQAWYFGFVAKLLLAYQLLSPPTTKCVELGVQWMWTYIGWVAFVLFGTLQVAVLFTFFALLAMHSTLLKYAMHEHSISVIITWDHLRHVTPVFFYLMLMHYLAPALVQQMQWADETVFSPQRLRLLSIVIVLALLFGAMHHANFDDDVLYMHKGGHPDVGRNCAMVFVISVVVSSVYIIYGVVHYK